MERTVDLLDGWVDLDRRVVHRGGSQELLTGREAALLVVLTRNPGTDCSRGRLLEEAWNLRPDTATRAIDTTVRRLRRKLEPQPSRPQLLLTVHGVGYRWAPSPDVLPTDSGAPRPTSPLAHVPRESVPLIGRESELASLMASVRPQARVTLVGPGGVGKSAVSRELVRCWAAAQARPAWWVSMEGAKQLDEAVWRVVHATGLGGQWTALPTLERCFGRLGAALLVCDGVDGLSDEDLETMLRGVEIPVVFTSRSRRPNTITHRIGPLNASDGAALLRAHVALQGMHALREEDLEAITRSLDGLPLALSLAVAHLRVLSPDQLVERLSGRPGGLSPPSHMVNWWADLPPPARRALAELSVLPEQFDLPLAEAVLGESVVATLTDLCDCSWLQPRDGEDGRAFVWLAPLHQQARTALDDEGARTVHRRVARHLAEEALSRLDLRYGPHRAEDARWLRRSLPALQPAAEAAAPAERATLWAALAHARAALGDGKGTAEAWEEVPGDLGAFQRGEPLSPDASASMRASARLAHAVVTGMLPPAQPAAEHARTVARQARDSRGLLEACRVLSHIEASRGDLKAAADVRREGLDAVGPIYATAAARLLPFPMPRADSLTPPELDRILADSRIAADRCLEVQALIIGAVLALQQQHVSRAKRCAEEAFGALWSIDISEVRAGGYGNLGVVMLELGVHREAAACFQLAWRDTPTAKAGQFRTLAGLGLASTWIDAGMLGKARGILDDIEELTDDPRLRLRVVLLRALANVLDRSGAVPDLQAMLVRCQNLQASTEIGHCCLWLAACDVPDATALLRRAEEIFARTGESELWAVHELLSVHGIREMTATEVDPGRYSLMVRIVRRLAKRAVFSS